MFELKAGYPISMLVCRWTYYPLKKGIVKIEVARWQHVGYTV